MSERTIIETQRQHVKIGVTPSLDECITTTWVETVVTPSIDVVRKGVLIEFAKKLSNELGGILVGRNLNWSSVLPTTNTKVVGLPQMVFTNSIMAIHVNNTTNRPLMSLMVVRGYKSVDVVHPKGG